MANDTHMEIVDTHDAEKARRALRKRAFEIAVKYGIPLGKGAIRWNAWDFHPDGHCFDELGRITPEAAKTLIHRLGVQLLSIQINLGLRLPQMNREEMRVLHEYLNSL
jgi:hypothetical protein